MRCLLSVMNLLAGLLCLPVYGVAVDDLIIEGATASIYLEGNHEYGEVRITKGAVVRIHKSNSGLTGAAIIKCATFFLDEVSTINGTDQGFYLASPGEGRVAAEEKGGNGGSYGGYGGRPSSQYGGEIYGTERGLDILPGGTGGRGATTISVRGVPVPGGFGGKAGASIAIEATSCVILGKMLMNGAVGYPGDPCPPRDGCNGPWGGGGGSGGGVLILSHDITVGKDAVLSATGGDTPLHPSGGGTAFGGGGGRIKIFYEQGHIEPRAKFLVNPGEDAAWSQLIPAQPGTIWIEKVPSIDQLLHPSADFNNDGIVNADDALILIEQWHKIEPTLTPTLLPSPTQTMTPAP